MSHYDPLKAKITDEATLKRILYDLGVSYERISTEIAARFCGHHPNMPAAWWAVRQQARILNGVYEMTEALEKLNAHLPVFAHVSIEDKTMVAFTPDRHSGEADRQVRTTFGRLASKFLPFATDKYIADLAADHVAELNNEIEFIRGDEIAQVYATEMGSIGACMSNKSFELQPTLVYDAPGIAMAVRRDNENRIIERAMVYEDGDDKRWIRAYPSGCALVKRLNRAGFKKGNWMGVKFNTIIRLDYSNHNLEGHKAVVAPYLDADGGHAAMYGSTVALLDGQLTAVTREQLAALNTRFGNAQSEGYTAVPSTNGYVTLFPVSSEDFTITDELTGEEINLLTRRVVKKQFWHEGRVVASYKEQTEYDVTVAGLVDGSVNKALIDYRGVAAFNHGSTVWFDTEENRRYCGMFKLSQEIYPGELEWQSRYAIKTVQIDGVEHIVKVEDCVSLLRLNDDGEPERTLMLRKALTKQHVKLHKGGGDDCWAEPNVKIYRTPTGRKVHPMHNDNIRVFWDGEADFRRNTNNASRTRLLDGITVWYRNAEDLKRLRASERYKQARDDYTAKLSFHQKLHWLMDNTYYDYVYSDAKIGNSFVKWEGSRKLSSLFESAMVTALATKYDVAPAQVLLEVCNIGLSQPNRMSDSTEAVLIAMRNELADALAIEAPTYLAPAVEVTDLPEPVLTIEAV